MSNPRRAQRELRDLLERLPVGTPQEVSRARTALQLFVKMRDAAFEGTGVSQLPGGGMLPGAGIILNIPQLIQQLKEGNYADVTLTLLSIGGDAAATFSVLVTAATEAGAITSATAGLAQAGVVAGLLGDAAGPAGIGLTTLVETFRIPSAANENQWKIFYIADVSGTLASWLFSRQDIGPHRELVRMARHGGYMRMDVTEACRVGHRRAHRYWVSTFQRSRANRRAARAAAHDSWEEYWLQLARSLESNLAPFPSGIGESFARRIINDTKTRLRNAARRAEAQRRRAAARAAAGGVWVTTEDGLELFLPDD